MSHTVTKTKRISHIRKQLFHAWNWVSLFISTDFCEVGYKSYTRLKENKAYTYGEFYNVLSRRDIILQVKRFRGVEFYALKFYSNSRTSLSTFNIPSCQIALSSHRNALEKNSVDRIQYSMTPIFQFNQT